MNAVEFIHRIATGDPQRRWILTPLGPSVFTGFVSGLIFLSLWINKFLHLPKFPTGQINLILALPQMVLGVGIMLWSLLHFAMAKGTPVPFNPPPRVVTSGPYAYVRNPMYDGAFIALTGLGILLRSLALAFVLVPLLILSITLFVRYIEEPELEKRLGDDYLHYKHRTPRFFPRIK